jgi:catechol 2,3-dioxygenase-like lactoylglutathione lyase family enzyme
MRPPGCILLSNLLRERCTMNPRITLITLGVDDLERAVSFYRDGLGFSTKGIVGTEFENGAVAFFNLESGLKLALWPRKSLAADSGLPLQPPSSTELSLAHNVGSQQEVDAAMQQAERAGARIVKSARATFYGGYAGYFLDPDGHLWEVAFNPGLATLG